MIRGENMKKSYLRILNILGMCLLFIGLILLLPVLFLPLYMEDAAFVRCFVVPAACAVVAGGACWLVLRKHGGMVDAKEGACVVTFVWIVAFLVSTVPFMMNGSLGFLDALFETVSGWTTTGLSVMNVAETPKIFLMWRSIMQFFGGVGLIAVMVVSLTGYGGMELYGAEGHADRLAPNIKQTVKWVMMIYLGYFAAGAVCYTAAGMSVFDAVNHAMAALSTGGFSTKVDSIGAYDSFPIELITIVLMLLGTTNFAVHLKLLRGDIKRVAVVGELRFMFAVLGVLASCVALFGVGGLYPHVSKTLRVTLFECVSALSTTGFSTVGYGDWRAFGVFALVILMLIGGGAGSTAGGLKLYRCYVMTKNFFWTLGRDFKPERIVVPHYIYKPEGKFYVTDKHMADLCAFAAVYFATFAAATMVVAAHGYSLQDAMFEIASSLGTVGLSIGVTSPKAPALVKITEILCMFLGRLEFFVIFFTFIKLVKDFIETAGRIASQ